MRKAPVFSQCVSFSWQHEERARSEEGIAVSGGVAAAPGRSFSPFVSLVVILCNPQKPQGSPWSCGRGELAQPHHAHESFLDVDQFALTFVFFHGAVGESFFQ